MSVRVGIPHFIIDDTTGQIGYRNRTTGQEVMSLIGQTDLAALGVATSYATPSNTQRIRSAMARSDRNTIVALVGPSTTRGVTIGGGTSQAVNSWPMQMANVLQKQGINAGASNFFGDALGWGNAQSSANTAGGDSRLSFTGTVTPNAVQTAGGSALAISSAGTINFTPPANVTKFVIWWRDGAAGRNFSWAIDAGAATTISSTGGASTPQQSVVSAGTAGVHTITISWVAGGVGILGISAYDDTASRREISLFNWGVPGARSDQLIYNNDLSGQIGMWNAAAPDLSILDDFFINDWRQSISITTAQANLQTAITQGLLSGNVAVTTPLWDNSSTGNASIQQQYSDAIVAVAQSNGVPIIDVRAAWVSYAAANGLGWYSDTVHPTALGYAVKASAIAEFIRRVRSI